MKKLLLIAFLFFYSGSAWAACTGTYTETPSNAQYDCADGDYLIVNEGVTLNRNDNDLIQGTNNSNVTIDNSGSLTTTYNNALDMPGASNLTINNNTTGLIRTNKSRTIYLGDSNTVDITNKGTIRAYTYCAICSSGGDTGPITINNSGTIETMANNWSTGVEVYESAIGITALGTGGSFTITNSGTIRSIDDDLAGIKVDDTVNATITNSGTIQGEGTGRAIHILDTGTETGTTIKLSGEPTFTNGIELGKTTTNIVLQNDITGDLTVEIYNYDSDLTITDNLSGNDTYSITVEDLDSDGAADDGTLTISGEDLEVAKNNKEYRGENTLTKLRGLFNAANYVGGTWPDHCTTVDPKDIDSKLDEVCNQRFVKLFHSYQTRDKVYDGTTSGIVGMLSPIQWKGFPLVSNIFVGYANQKGDFDNGEYLGGDNYVLGFKNTYENKGFKASLTPMIGVNDLGVIDYDTDKAQTISNNFLSEFAAVNGKIKKKIATGEDRSLNISVETTYGLQRFPDYISKFTDGDLSVDESIEQLLSGGFEVSYIESLPGNFVIKPYFGANLNQNLTGQTKIIADGENKNVSPVKENWSGYYAGASLTKEVKGTDFDLNLMYGNEDGLINQIASFSLTKSFGKAKVKTAVLEKTPDFPKIDESLTTQDYDKDFKELETLKNLNKKLKAENTALKAQNEKLKLLAEKKLQQDKAKEKLIVELLKENEKLKLTNQIFKNRILDNENEELLRSIEGEAKKSESNKLVLLYFLALYITTVFLLTSLIASLYNKIRYRQARLI